MKPLPTKGYGPLRPELTPTSFVTGPTPPFRRTADQGPSASLPLVAVLQYSFLGERRSWALLGRWAERRPSAAERPFAPFSQNRRSGPICCLVHAAQGPVEGLKSAAFTTHRRFAPPVGAGPRRIPRKAEENGAGLRRGTPVPLLRRRCIWALLDGFEAKMTLRGL